MENSKFDILLNKFIEGNISSEELNHLKSFEEFKFYKNVLQYSSEFTTPQINEEVSYKNFLEKTTRKKKTKIVQLNAIKIISSIAASILIVFGIFQFLNSGKTYKTNYGEQLSFFLPDSSEVILNAQSIAKFNPKKWSDNRIVNLTGEAFFKVKKGSTFKVKTQEGSVSVLGTQFNVNEQTDFLEVQCYEGKVRVERNGNTYDLTKGKAYRQIKNQEAESWSFVSKVPSWKNKETSFNNIPLKYMLESFKNVYGVTIKTENMNLEKRFSGSFPNTDIKTALETIKNAMDIAYKINNKQVILRGK